MSMYTDDNEDTLNQADNTDGENTMAVLSTLGGGSGGEDPMAEGEPLGLDASEGKAKVSGSGLAVGVVVVLGAVALGVMKFSLGAIGVDTDPSSAIAEIDGFIASHTAAENKDAQGPLGASDQESNQVLEELKQDPTDHQVPAEKIATNPFQISALLAGKRDSDEGPAVPNSNARAKAIEKARQSAAKLKVDMISGQIAYINGEIYRAGDEIGESGFVLEKIDGLSCIIRTTDQHKLPFRLRYR